MDNKQSSALSHIFPGLLTISGTTEITEITYNVSLTGGAGNSRSQITLLKIG